MHSVMNLLLIVATLAITASMFDEVYSQSSTANFRVTDITGGVTTLQWNTVNGAVHYDVARDRGADGDLLFAESGTNTVIDPHGEAEGTVLEYEFRAYDSNWNVIAERNISVTVPANIIPTVNIDADVSVISKERITIGATVSDEHPEYLQFRWSETTSENARLFCKTCESVQIRGPMTNVPITVTLKLIVTDLSGDSAEDTVNITVNPVPNGVPIADAGRNKSVDEDKSVMLNGSMSFDSDGAIVSYEWVQISGPIVSLTDPTISKPRFTTPEVTRDTYFTFKLVVTDDDGDTDDAYVVVTVKNIPNKLPTSNAGEDTIVEPGDTVMLDGSDSTDPEDTDLTYSWVQKTGQTVTLSSNTAESPTFTAPATTGALRLVFLLTVTDEDGGSDSDMTEIIVTSIDAPRARAGGLQITSSFERITLDGSNTVTDPNGNPIYTWIQIDGQQVPLSGSNTLSPTFTAPTVTGGVAEQLTFKLTVTDAYQESSDTVNVLVADNTPPTSQIISFGSTLDGDKAGSIIKFVGYAVDLDGSDSISSHTWSKVSGPRISIVESDGGDVYENNVINSYREFTAPNVNSNTDIIIKFTVVDHLGERATDENTFTIIPNTIPTANAGDDRVVSPSATVRLSGNGHDTDGDSLTYGWTQMSGTAVMFTENTKGITFAAPSTVGVLKFELTVSDGGYEVTDAINVRVRENIHDPEADAGSDRNVVSGDAVRLSGNGSDQDGDPLTYSWSKVSGPSIELSDRNTRNPSFTAPETRIEAYIVLELTVSDSERLGTDNVTITVTPTDSLPTVDAGADLDTYSGNTVNLGGTGNDPDGQRLTYLWSKVSGPSVDIQNSNRANASFVAPTVSEDTDIVLKLTVTVGSDTVSDTVTITVLENGRHEITMNGDRGATYNVQEGGTITIDTTVTNPDNDQLTYTWKLITYGDISQTEKNRIESDINVNREDISFRSPNISTGERVGLVFMLTVSDGEYTASEFAYVYIRGQ